MYRRVNGPEVRVSRWMFLVVAPLLILGGCQPKTKVVPEKTTVTRAWAPDWYEQTPRDDDGTVRKTAQGLGATQEISEEMAIMQARVFMAQSLQVQVEALQKQFKEQFERSGDLTVLQRFQSATSMVTDQAIRGSHVVRKETYLEDDGNWRTFVLMELDGREIDLAMVEAVEGDDPMDMELETRLRSSTAWAELEQRADELRAERTGDEESPAGDTAEDGDGS
jgi:hypothetical protein